MTINTSKEYSNVERRDLSPNNEIKENTSNVEIENNKNKKTRKHKKNSLKKKLNNNNKETIDKQTKNLVNENVEITNSKIENNVETENTNIQQNIKNNVQKNGFNNNNIEHRNTRNHRKRKISKDCENLATEQPRKKHKPYRIKRNEVNLIVNALLAIEKESLREPENYKDI
ncbi:hypothetical protein H8356DRAFT_1390633 [Neocallimastix lanati (nom. inval.)]|nr:hypothetical protein H8356DRAFT_1390633 [Neocallimastix sp. JGI-2020a]